MSPEEKYHFNRLKKACATVFLENHSAQSPQYQEWKGQDIGVFQEDIREKVKGTISEKWFYTYFKKESEKLPRIDMLHLLSTYAGYENWAAFCQEEIPPTPSKINTSKKPIQTLYIGIVIAVGAIGLGLLAFYPKNYSYHFCFKDKTFGSPASTIKILLLKEGENPIEYTTDEDGCLLFSSKEKKVRLIITEAPFRQDTITRYHATEEENKITLETNFYYHILKDCVQGNIENWQKRRSQLHDLIHEEAIILQSFPKTKSLSLIPKQEFINMMTLPSKNLKNIDIIQTEMQGKQLKHITFCIQN